MEGSGGAGMGLALIEALGQVALDPEGMALLSDQLGDRGGGFGHLEGDAEGAGEGCQLVRQQASDPFLDRADGGRIQGYPGPGQPGAVQPLAESPGAG